MVATLSDRRTVTAKSGDPTTIGKYTPVRMTAADYYPFGMAMPGRHDNGSLHRYGFNGKEMDNEALGVYNWLDYGMRAYDPRTGRFWSVDPLTAQYPWYTPYQYAGNKPIRYIDRDGLEEAQNDVNNSFAYNVYQIKASITNNLIRLSPNNEKNKLRDEFSKVGITDETFINSYHIRLRTIVTNYPADEINPQAWFEIENKFVVEPKNTLGREMLEAAFDVLNTMSVVPSPGSTGILAARGGGQMLISEFRKSMGILFNVKRLSVIGETKAALQGVQKIEDIMEAGRAFVGKNAKEIRTVKGKLEGFESADGLRRFRPPAKKSFGGGTIQANFEQRINKDIRWGEKATEAQRSNMHVVSDKVYTP